MGEESPMEESDLDVDDPESTFQSYTPKWESYNGIPLVKHPGNICESTSLACVQLPDSGYPKVHLNPFTLRNGIISSLQFETVKCAVRAHNIFIGKLGNTPKRCGMLIGDGPGVGKGRQLAAIISHYWNKGHRKVLYLSTSTSLIPYLKDDLSRIDPGIPVISLKDFSLTKKIEMTNEQGVLFLTYTTLNHYKKDRKGNKLFHRCDQVVAFLGTQEKFKGLIIFDECHLAKNSCSITSKQSLFLQNWYPDARIVYSSATMASKPEHLGYMPRLGLWGPGTFFHNDASFFTQTNKSGVSGMELLAADLKQRGLYLAREISFKEINSIMFSTEPDENFNLLYDKCAKLWRLIIKQAKETILFKRSEDKEFNTNMSSLWAAHQRFFSTLIVASKAQCTIKLTNQFLAHNFAVIIGLQKTGEAKLLARTDTKSADVYSCAAEILEEVLQHELINLDPSLPPNEQPDILNCQDKKYISRRNRILLEYIRNVKNYLPRNYIDSIIHGIGRDRVAELTGRTLQQVQESDGTFKTCQRKKVGAEDLNIAERRQFMDGTKLVAIISDAASTGISLHSDSECKNTKKRVHVTVEMPWSAEKAVQQFGRTNRSNQICSPEYVLISSQVPGEKRFYASVQQRMKFLGAITKGDQQASSKIDLGSDWEQEYREKALKLLFQDLLNEKLAESEVFGNYDMQEFPKIGALELRNILIDGFIINELGKSDAGTFNTYKFLNRVLGLDLEDQEVVMKVFDEYTKAIIMQHKENGKYNCGIKDFKLKQGKVVTDRITKKSFVLPGNEGRIIHLCTVPVDYGIMWRQIKHKAKNGDLIFLTSRKAGVRNSIIAFEKNPTSKYGLVLGSMISPSFGTVPNKCLSDLTKHYSQVKNVDMEKIRKLWKLEYKWMEDGECIHLYKFNECHLDECSAQSRIKIHYVLTGSVIEIWDKLEGVFGENNIKTIRFTVSEKETLIGVRVLRAFYKRTLKVLKEARNLKL